MESFVKSFQGTKIRIPDYEHSSIVNLPALFKSVLLGNKDSVLFDDLSKRIDLTNIKNVIFFLVDGFGLKQWNEHHDNLEALKRFEQIGYFSELDSVFPSSTPVALNALHTNGLTPAQHGLIDWWMYVEEIDKIIATLPFSAMGNYDMDSLLEIGAKPSILINAKTTFEKFKEVGIDSRVFIKQGYSKSCYTKVAYRGSKIILHKDVNDLFKTLLTHIGGPKTSNPRYNFVYWGDIDGIGHEYGPGSSEHEQVIKEYFAALNQFIIKSKSMKDTLLVISADHGQINVAPNETIYLDSIPGLSKLLRVSSNGNLILPWGGKREVFLAIKEGKQSEALCLLQEKIGEHVELLKSDAALRAGLFGKTLDKHPALKSRIGDIIVLPKAKKTVWYHHPGEDQINLKGNHGGLSDAEVKVPFGLLRLN